MSQSLAFTPHHIMLIKENNLKERGATIYHHIWKLKNIIYFHLISVEAAWNYLKTFLKNLSLDFFFFLMFKTLFCHKFSGQVNFAVCKPWPKSPIDRLKKKRKEKKCIPSARHVVDTQQLLVELRRKHIVLAHLVHRGLGICDGLIYRKLRGADLSNLRKPQETEKLKCS